MKISLLRCSALVSAIYLISALFHPDAEAAKEKSAPPPLAERAKSLEKEAVSLAALDAQRVAPKALGQARRWAKEAIAAAKKGDAQQGERSLLRSRLQIELARELISLAGLQRRIAAIEQQLAAIRSKTKKRKAKLSERDEYLDLLKVTRQ